MDVVSVSLKDPPFKAKVPDAPLRPLRGYGAQLFTQLFNNSAAVPQHLADHLAPLRLGHSRIAVESEAASPGPARDALMHTIALAEAARANVNLTWWHGPYFRHPNQPTPETFIGKELMHGFADVIEEARRRFKCVTHLTIQNEPNSHDIGREHKPSASMAVYERLYRSLDEELKARRDPRAPSKTLRAAFELVGGDLVAGGSAGSQQADWIKFMQENMADVLNGYSIHVYWTHGDFAKFESRLTHLLDFKIHKPVYVTEYGVRGPDFHDEHRKFEQGSLHNNNIEDSIESAFQHAWFNALAPQYGIIGLAKWACYRIDTGTTSPAGERRPERDSGMLRGIGRDFEPVHNYRVTLLFNRLLGPNRRAAGLGGLGTDTIVSRFAGPAGDHSLVALNRSGEAKELQIDVGIANRTYAVAAWNHNGDGQLGQHEPSVSSSDRKIATVTVPPSSLTALSTTPLGF
jgi:hypothetical protein